MSTPEPSELFAQIETLLDGIDRHEDDPRGGWWQTPDGAKIGRIKVRELKELLVSYLATPPAATREAGPLPQEGAEISDEELAEVASAAGLAWETWEDELLAFARAVWDRAVLARWGGAEVQPVAVSERPWERDGWALQGGRCWLRGKVERDWRLMFPLNSGVPQLRYCFDFSLPHWALPVPAADKGEGQP
jgi:hypothetical protein